MKKYSTCCGTISKYECPNYLSPHYLNSKVFGLSKESNKKSWCKLHDEPLSPDCSKHCGMFKEYKIRINITADARLLEGIDSPYALKTKLREHVFKLLNGYGELPEVSVEFEKVIDDD